SFPPGREAAYLTLSSLSVKPLFRGFSLAVLRGVSSLSVGQWWRIIGTFITLAIVILKKTLNRLFILQRKPNWCFVRLRNEKRGGFPTSFYS
ncbi:hypothetical protein M5U04_09475, partial [Xenorhabdus sp. XENO-1]|uniref:hypothetical protein n=1 Tax=Xenorhabdus bovienii TaxID=40576 RepID=UPI0020CA2EC9